MKFIISNTPQVEPVFELTYHSLDICDSIIVRWIYLDNKRVGCIYMVFKSGDIYYKTAIYHPRDGFGICIKEGETLWDTPAMAKLEASCELSKLAGKTIFEVSIKIFEDYVRLFSMYP